MRVPAALLLAASLLCAAALAGQNQTSRERAGQHVRAGNVLYDQGKYEEAAKAYLQAIEVDPNWYSPHYELGQTYGQLKRSADAVRELELALKLNPDCSLCYQALGNIADDNGNSDQAIGFYKKAIGAAPEDGQPHFNLAIAYLRLNRVDDSISELREAERLSPKYASPYFVLGNLSYRQGKLFVAWDQLFQAIKLETSGRRYEEAKKLIDVNIILDNKLSSDESADHLGYCLSRAASMVPEAYRKRFPNAETYADTLDEAVKVLGTWATILGEAAGKRAKKRAPELANLVKIHKAGYLAPYLLLTTGERFAPDRQKYETENPGKVGEFQKWAQDNNVAITPLYPRCEVRWMNRVW